MPELMAAEGDLRISFRIVRVCTIEQTTLMEACNMRERPRTPSARRRCTAASQREITSASRFRI